MISRIWEDMARTEIIMITIMSFQTKRLTKANTTTSGAKRTLQRIGTGLVALG